MRSLLKITDLILRSSAQHGVSKDGSESETVRRLPDRRPLRQYSRGRIAVAIGLAVLF
jgi:hypothetical protein